MQRIAIYGKGGIGKSVVATSLSASFAIKGKRVLHVGCDPKHDSAIRLTPGEAPLRTVLDLLKEKPRGLDRREILSPGRHGIECCEAGGPEPGVGCAGRGVARTLELLEDAKVISSGDHDVVVFDVLGDVVCGGFAAPLRAGFAEKVLIVTSEEPMSLYAANNICKAVRTYAPNGVVLAGLVANLRREAGGASVEVFASLVDTTVLGTIHYDERVSEAERRMLTVVEHDEACDTSKTFEALAKEVAELDPSKVPEVMPLTDEELFRFIKDL